MASRRPPLFELLQQDDGKRQGRGSTRGKSGVLGGTPAAENPANKTATNPADQSANAADPGATRAQQGVSAENAHVRAEGAVETKPVRTSTKFEELEEITADPPARRGQLDRGSKLRPSRPGQDASRAPASSTHQPEPSDDPDRTRTAGAADWSGMHPSSAFRVRLLWVYFSAAAVLVIVIAVWQLGYHLGGQNMRRDLEPFLNGGEQATPIVDPLASGQETPAQRQQPVPGSPLVRLEPTASPAPGGEARQVETQQPGQPVTIEPEVTPPTPASAPAIDVLVDVREQGNNYLKLASGMTLERARGLAEYLSASGIPAMALDEGRRGYGLYTDFPVPSGQFNTMSTERDRHERRVIELLDRTPRDFGGPYDARNNLWMRFDG